MDASLPCGRLTLASRDSLTFVPLRRPTGAVQAGAVADWAGICRWAERRATLSGTVIGAQWREEAHWTLRVHSSGSVSAWAPGPDLLAALLTSSLTDCEGPASRVRWPEHLPWHQQLRRSSAETLLALRSGPLRGQSRS